MIDFLRDGVWQGVGGIVASISLLLYIFVERKKIFAGTTKSIRLTVNFSLIGVLLFIVIMAMSISITLSGGAGIITTVLINGLKPPVDAVLSSSLLGFGLASFFSIFHFILLKNYTKNQTIYILIIFFGFIITGVINGIQNSLFESTKFELITQVYEWGRGAFIGGLIMTWASLIDKNPKGMFYEEKNLVKE